MKMITTYTVILGLSMGISGTTNAEYGEGRGPEDHMAGTLTTLDVGGMNVTVTNVDNNVRLPKVKVLGKGNELTHIQSGTNLIFTIRDTHTWMIKAKQGAEPGDSYHMGKEEIEKTQTKIKELFKKAKAHGLLNAVCAAEFGAIGRANSEGWGRAGYNGPGLGSLGYSEWVKEVARIYWPEHEAIIKELVPIATYNDFCVKK